MNKHGKRIFLEAELVQSKYILADEEIKGKIASFLFDYVTIEAFYKRLLIVEREYVNGIKMTDKEKRQLSVRINDVERVLKFFEIDYEPELVNRIFGSKDNNYMECTIKKLRDRLVHKVNDNVLRAILERYDSINEDLEAFNRLFEH